MLAGLVLKVKVKVKYGLCVVVTSSVFVQPQCLFIFYLETFGTFHAGD